MNTHINTGRQVAASIHDDGVVLLHTGSGRLFASNRTGARIWEALERSVPVPAIATGITDCYGIPHEKAAREVACFLEQLEHHGLLERSDAR